MIVYSHNFQVSPICRAVIIMCFVSCKGSSRSASVSTSALSGSSSGSTSSVMSTSGASVSGRPPRASYSSLRDTSYVPSVSLRASRYSSDQVPYRDIQRFSFFSEELLSYFCYKVIIEKDFQKSKPIMIKFALCCHCFNDLKAVSWTINSIDLSACQLQQLNQTTLFTAKMSNQICRRKQKHMPFQPLNGSGRTVYVCCRCTEKRKPCALYDK